MIGLVQTILLFRYRWTSRRLLRLAVLLQGRREGETGELWDSFPTPAEAKEAAILLVAGLDTQELCSKCCIHHAYKYTVPGYLWGICFKTPVDT